MSSQYESAEIDILLNYGKLALIMIWGCGLRLFQLGFQCMWTEEVYTLKLTGMPYQEIISQVMASDFNPPLFYIIASLFRALFQIDVAIRYPSLIFGILLIPVIYLVGTEYKNRFTGLCAAGFVAFLYPLIYYSQFGRAYEMCIFFFALTVLIYLKLYTYGTDVYAILFGISAGLAIYTHLFIAVPISLLVGSLVLSTRRREGLISGASTLTVCLPVIGLFFAVVQNRLPSVGFNYGMSILTLLYRTPLELFDLAFPFFMIFCAAAWMQGRRLDKLFLYIAAVTILFGIVCSIVTPIFPRYYLGVVVLLIPVTAAAVSDLISDKYSGSKDTLILVVFLIGLLFTQAPDLIYHYFTQQYICLVA